MKFRLGTLALAAGSLLSVALVGCNPPIDEKKTDTTAPAVTPETKPAETPAPAPETKPAETPAPAVTPAAEPPKAETPAVEPPKAEETKPATDAPVPKA